VTLHLDPLTLREHQDALLENLLQDGSLPAIADMHEARDREIDLKLYAAKPSFAIWAGSAAF
jgi:hypothetical protein